jgi:hypothetical protein
MIWNGLNFAKFAANLCAETVRVGTNRIPDQGARFALAINMASSKRR